MRKEIAELVGKYVSSHRFTARLTQQQLADKVGLSRGAISQIENAQQLPTLETLYALAGALEVEPWDLLPARKQVRA